MAIILHSCSSEGRYCCPSFVEGVPESGDVEGPARVPDLLSGPVGLRSKGHECKSSSVPPCSDQVLGTSPRNITTHTLEVAGNPVESSCLLHSSGQPAIVFHFMASGTQPSSARPARNDCPLDCLREWAPEPQPRSFHLTK